MEPFIFGETIFWSNERRTTKRKFTQIAAGIYHSIGVRDDGSIVFWGNLNCHVQQYVKLNWFFAFICMYGGINSNISSDDILQAYFGPNNIVLVKENNTTYITI